MNPIESKRNRAMLAAVASALALGLAACGEKPAGDQFGQNLERGNASSSAMDRAADATERKLDQAGNAIDDAAVTAKVKSALIAEPHLKSLTINVDTMAGVVTLKGTANSQESRQKAEQIAAAVEGVRDVRNELVVVSS